MGAVVDFVSDAWDAATDFVGDVFEAVGDVIEDVGDVIGDAVEWIDDNVVQPILDDPITFIVTAAAVAWGIPGLSFAGPGTAAAAGIATTGSRLAQGDDFDDAIKAGAFSAVGQGISSSITQGIKTGGADFSPNLYSTADEIAAAKAASSAAAGTKASSIGAESIDKQIANAGSAGTSAVDDQILRDLADANAIQRDVFPEYEMLADASGDTQLVPKNKQQPGLDITDDTYYKPKDQSAQPSRGPYGADIPDEAAMQKVSSSPYKSSIDGQGSYSDIGKVRPAGFEDVDVGQTSDYADMSRRTDKPVPRGVLSEPKVGEPGYEVPIEERVVPPDNYVLDKDGNPVPAGSKSGWEGAKNLGKAVVEEAGDWVWDGVKWVWNNPMDAILYGTAGLALIDSLNKDNPPGGTDTTTNTDKEAGDDRFNANLPALELQRDPQRFSTGFDRNKNPYESDLYKYGETQGEHGFYGNTVYQPVEYTQPVTAAQGGSIGALNSQMPSYYRYGAMPMASGGYASGGLRSLKHDGRSDHIPAMLSDGEYVIDAETVALLGNGSNEAGANRLEGMRREVRKQKGAALSKGKFSSNAKSPLSYIKQRRG